MSNNFFYMRVSTKERNQELAIKDRQQTFDRQKGILQKAGYELTDDNTFAERISGKTNASDRQEFEKMLTLLEENDWVVFTETSRFSRSYVLGMEMLDTLIFDKKVNVRFVSNGIELCANGKFNPYTWFTISQMLLSDELQRRVIAYNTSNGLQRKKEQGVVLGRPCPLTKEQCLELKTDHSIGMKNYELAEKYGISKPTVKKILEEN